jgi:hypothetical protein
VVPLANGEKDDALAALKEILEATTGAGMDVRAITVLPHWIGKVYRNGPQPFCCETTGEHPERAVMLEDAPETKTLCQCDSCQRWASKALRGLTLTVRGARHGVNEMTLQHLRATIEMSEVDFDGWKRRQRERAEQLGVLDEWIEFTYGRHAIWPDRCALTGLPSDQALRSRERQLCQCENCQRWAFKTLRELRMRVIAPLLAREDEKALAALKEIAGEPPPLPRPAPPAPDPMLWPRNTYH